MAEIDPQRPYLSSIRWSNKQIDALVIGCSDGRFTPVIDHFLAARFNIARYDRLYVPGGPGALATSGSEYARADLYRQEYAFLAKAHQITQIVLLFHGASSNGPEYAVCANYRRLFPNLTPAEINAQQESDLKEVARVIIEDIPGITIHAVRAEVRKDEKVQLVPLLLETY